MLYNSLTRSFASTLAPCVINILMTSGLPFSAAKCKACLPFCSDKITLITVNCNNQSRNKCT